MTLELAYLALLGVIAVGAVVLAVWPIVAMAARRAAIRRRRAVKPGPAKPLAEPDLSLVATSDLATELCAMCHMVVWSQPADKQGDMFAVRCRWSCSHHDALHALGLARALVFEQIIKEHNQ